MVVEKEFYKRLKLFWWVFLAGTIYSVLESICIQIATKALKDNAEKGIEPSDFKVKFVRFLAEHGKILTYIAIAFLLARFLTMLLLRKYSKELLLAAVIGLFETALNFILTAFYWNAPYNTTTEIFTLILLLALFGWRVIYALGMRNMVKPFSEDTAKLWKVFFCCVIIEFAMRLINAVMTVLVYNRPESFKTIGNIYGLIYSIFVYALVLYEILCLVVTVLMFRKKLEQQETAAAAALAGETAE